MSAALSVNIEWACCCSCSRRRHDDLSFDAKYLSLMKKLHSLSMYSMLYRYDLNLNLRECWSYLSRALRRKPNKFYTKASHCDTFALHVHNLYPACDDTQIYQSGLGLDQWKPVKVEQITAVHWYRLVRKKDKEWWVEVVNAEIEQELEKWPIKQRKPRSIELRNRGKDGENTTSCCRGKRQNEHTHMSKVIQWKQKMSF